MSTRFAELLPRLLPDIPGCPGVLALAAIREAVNELCERALIWREDLAPVSLAPDTPSYTLTAPAGSRIVMTLTVSAAGRPLSPTTPESLEHEWPNWFLVRSETPSRYLLPRPNLVRVVPTPSVALPGALLVRVALAPLRTALETEDFLLDGWEAVIAHGALARLMESPGRPWSDPQLSLHHARQFRRGLNDAKARAAKGGTPRTLTARARAFG